MGHGFQKSASVFRASAPLADTELFAKHFLYCNNTVEEHVRELVSVKKWGERPDCL